MLTQFITGYLATQCLYVAAKLKIADHLEFKSLSITELATITNSHPESLSRVMNCLISMGYFEILPNEVYALNDNAKELLTNSSNTMRDYIILTGEELYQSAGGLIHSVQTGTSAFNHIYGMNHWDYLDKYTDKAKTFHDAMEKGTSQVLDQIIKSYDFAPYKNIIDIGGGSGHLLCKILALDECKTGINFDLANAQQSALAHIQDNDLTTRCEFVSGNFFHCIPRYGDLYLLKVVLHDWCDTQAKKILLNCSEAMSRDSKLLIIEKIPEEKISSISNHLSDINMLAVYNGKERTLDDFKILLEKSGFKINNYIRTKCIFNIIEAELC